MVRMCVIGLVDGAHVCVIGLVDGAHVCVIGLVDGAHVCVIGLVDGAHVCVIGLVDGAHVCDRFCMCCVCILFFTVVYIFRLLCVHNYFTGQPNINKSQPINLNFQIQKAAIRNKKTIPQCLSKCL